MHKEESVLFPGFVASKRMPQGSIGGGGPIHSIARSIGVIEAEHQDCEDMLLTLRRLTADYAPFQDACPTDMALYQGLERFESDTREHMSVEDNILFSRVLKD
jgi:regulator of cell morphogenesis and NO signaling